MKRGGDGKDIVLPLPILTCLFRAMALERALLRARTVARSILRRSSTALRTWSVGAAQVFSRRGAPSRTSHSIRSSIAAHTKTRITSTTLTMAPVNEDNEDDEKKMAAADDADDSDVELEGMDLEGLDEPAGDDDLDEADKLSNADVMEDDDDKGSQLAHEDHDELEAAKNERMELMAAEAKMIADAPLGKASVEEQLQYLLGQSEVFAHFLAGTWNSVILVRVRCVREITSTS
jgi:hypothetical protein